MTRLGLGTWLLLGLLAAPAWADHDDALRLQQAGAILPLETLLDKARTRQPGRVLGVELESEHGRYVYELILLDKAGRVWEMELDAATGEILEQAQED
jgi:uncharacterized membrane protein YkoI